MMRVILKSLLLLAAGSLIPPIRLAHARVICRIGSDNLPCLGRGVLPPMNISLPAPVPAATGTAAAAATVAASTLANVFTDESFNDESLVTGNDLVDKDITSLEYHADPITSVRPVIKLSSEPGRPETGGEEDPSKKSTKHEQEHGKEKKK